MVKAYGGMLLITDVLLVLLKVLFHFGEAIYRLFVPVDEESVVGEIVLITGTGHGIGKELALQYAALGAVVVCWDLNPEANEETVNEIKKLGCTTVYSYKCDVSNREEVLKTAERVRREVGVVSILVNNAGIMPCHKFLDHSPEEIRKIFDINVLAHMWMLQAFLPGMIARNKGHIVALSSMAGVVGFANLVPYCGSKFAVKGLMEALNEELRENDLNIKFTTIFPYMVDTGLCKNPKIRFPSLMAMIPPKVAAAKIVDAQRRHVVEDTIPSYWLPVSKFLRTFPLKSVKPIKDFLASGVDAETSSL